MLIHPAIGVERLTIRLPDEKHNRLKELAQTKGISVNKLIKELFTIAKRRI